MANAVTANNTSESFLVAFSSSDDDMADIIDIISQSETETREEYNSEMMRLLTYPDFVPYDVAKSLAKDGYYSLNSSMVCCHFCGASTSISEVILHSCNGNRSNNIAIPDDTSNYRYEAYRLLSFLNVNWNKMVEPGSKHYVGALDLAKSGFYYTGVGDAARCVFCRLEVRGWEEGDSADSEHRRWNPTCSFLNSRSVGNIKLGEEAREDNVVQDCVNMATPMRSPSYIIPAKDSCGAISEESLGIRKIHTGRHPEYSTVASRRASYNMWPLSLRQRPEQLSDAGFFYTGKGDRVICFQCGGGLKDWGNQDEPWIEHAVWFPQCAYLNMIMTPEFIQKVQLAKNQQSSGEFNMSSISSDSFRRSEASTRVPTPVTTPANQPPVAPAETPAGEEVPSHRQCKVCMDKELGIVFLPCGHMAACIDCAPQLKTCPVCRGELTAYVRAFLP